MSDPVENANPKDYHPISSAHLFNGSSKGLQQICKGWVPGHACSAYRGPVLIRFLGVLLRCNWKQNQIICWKCNNIR